MTDQRGAIAGLERQHTELEQERQRIYDDQTRLCENIKSLGSTVEERRLLQRYTEQLAQQEDRLDALRQELADTVAALGRENDTLRQLLENLSFEIRAD